MSNKSVEVNCLLSGKSPPSTGKQGIYSPVETSQVTATGLGELDPMGHNRESHSVTKGTNLSNFFNHWTFMSTPYLHYMYPIRKTLLPRTESWSMGHPYDSFLPCCWPKRRFKKISLEEIWNLTLRPQKPGRKIQTEPGYFGLKTTST